MAEPIAVEGICPGVDILGLCLVVDPFLEAILYALPLILAFLAAALTGKKWRTRIRGWLYGARWSTAYAGLLDWLLNKLDHFFGPPFNWRAFDRSFALVLAYGFVLFWLHVMLVGADKQERLIGFGLALLIGVGCIILPRAIRRWHVHARAGSPPSRQQLLHRREQVLQFLLWPSCILIAAVFSGVTAGAGAAPIVGVLGVTGVIGVGLGLGLGIGAFPGVVAALIATALIISAMAAGVTNIGGFLGILLVLQLLTTFLFALPIINAVFDWLSLLVSRWLMGRLRNDALRPSPQRRFVALIGHLTLDAGLALLCLFGVAMVVANLVHGMDLSHIWEGYSDARLTPFYGLGAAMTVMMLSTLVPTALHLFFALLALAVIRPPYAARTAHWSQEDQEGGEIGTQMLVALYLTACAGFALLTLWAAGRLIIWGLDGLVGGAGIWPLIFDTADRFVIF